MSGHIGRSLLKKLMNFQYLPTSKTLQSSNFEPI